MSKYTEQKKGDFKPGLSFHVDLKQNDLTSLSLNLKELVEASGGDGGILATWEGEDLHNLHSVSCGIDGESEQSLCLELTRFIPELAKGDLKAVNELQGRIGTEEMRKMLGGRNALAIPVVAGGRPLGVFCLLHNGDVPGFVKDSPQMYNLVADHLEVVINNAALLQKLLRERLWYESLLRNSKDGIVIIDMEGRIVGINAAMERMSGWTASEVVGTPYHKVFPLQLEQRFDGYGQKKNSLALSKEKRLLDWSIFEDAMEGQFTTRSGKVLDVEISGVTVVAPNKNAFGWFMVLRDISQRKELERLGKIFLSAMSHELQTPIAVIKGFAGLLSDPELELSPQAIREKAAVIYDESDRLQKMVRQMLEATSIQAGGIKLKRESVSLAELIERALRRFEKMAAEKKVQLSAEYAPDLPTVWADPDRLDQVLTNLVENALKHGAGDKVVISVEEEFDFLLVRVSDHGPGIAVEEQGRIFGMFQRGTETKVRGSGLGLFIAQAIVEAHGGRIGVETVKGGGACFYFSVPKEMETP